MAVIDIPNLAGRINQGVPRDQLAPTQTPAAQNMTVIDGVVQKRTGYVEDAATKPAGDQPFAGGRHYADGFSGLKAFWAFTRQKALRKGALTDAWSDATNGMTFQAGADQFMTVAEGVDAATYKNNLFVCQNHTDPLTALNGSLGGDESVVWFTDSPAGSLSKLTGALGYNDPTGDDYHRAKGLFNFDGHLFLLNTFERVNDSLWAPLPYRLRWSDKHKFTTADHWNPSAAGSLAGYQDFRQGFGGLLAGGKLGSGMALYLEEAIATGQRTGSKEAPFSFDIRVPGFQLYAPRLWVEANEVHYVVGADRQIYVNWGGKVPERIGDKVKTRFFKDINKSAAGNYLIRARSFAAHLRDIHAVAFFLTEGTSLYPNVAWVYYYQDRDWDRWVLPNGKFFTGWGEWRRAVGQVAENLPVLGDAAGDIFQWDYAALTDDAAAIDAWVTTPDLITRINQNNQVVKVGFDASGDGGTSSVEIGVSNDAGKTFPATTTIPLTENWNACNVALEATGYQNRIRFRNSVAGEKFQLGRIRVELADVGEVVT